MLGIHITPKKGLKSTSRLDSLQILLYHFNVNFKQSQSCPIEQRFTTPGLGSDAGLLTSLFTGLLTGLFTGLLNLSRRPAEKRKIWVFIL